MSFLTSAVLNLITINSSIESDNQDELENFIDNMKLLANISNLSLLFGGVFLMNIPGSDSVDRIYEIDLHRINDKLKLYDINRKLIEIDCRKIEE